MPRTSCTWLAPLVFAACATAPAGPRVRPAAWAQPVIGGAVRNWYRVDDALYRCEQPSAAGMRALAAFGIRSVVNLREFHRDAGPAAGSGLTVIEVPLAAGDLDYAHLVDALAAVVAAPKPVAVHCWHGSDRTGAVIAAWRVAIGGWAPADALDEMVAGGFGHSAWFDNLRQLIGELDPARLCVDLAARTRTPPDG
ncbi:MAG: tyrosine-protein phosphatase [Planctomycetota bacterium]